MNEIARKATGLALKFTWIELPNSLEDYAVYTVSDAYVVRQLTYPYCRQLMGTLAGTWSGGLTACGPNSNRKSVLYLLDIYYRDIRRR